MWNAFKYVYKSPWNHYFTLLDFLRVVSKCSGDDISDSYIASVLYKAAVSHVWEEQSKWMRMGAYWYEDHMHWLFQDSPGIF